MKLHCLCHSLLYLQDIKICTFLTWLPRDWLDEAAPTVWTLGPGDHVAALSDEGAGGAIVLILPLPLPLLLLLLLHGPEQSLEGGRATLEGDCDGVHETGVSSDTMKLTLPSGRKK